MERTILHSDMNCFYASVEMMEHPELRGLPLAVSGNTETRHGIILAKSEKAKKAGVKTGMTAWEARERCPELLLVPPHYEEYVKFSKMAHQIYRRYTEEVEPYGMDECWLDVTKSGILGDGRAIAEAIRSAMKRELGLTVSVGVSFNKIFAKLGSDMKKPDAVTVISRGDVAEKVWPLPVSALLMAGPKSAARLRSFGIDTIGKLAAADPAFLRWQFGKNGLLLRTYARGEDAAPVMPYTYAAPIKTVGRGATCIADLTNDEEVSLVLLELSQDVGRRLRLYRLRAGGVAVTVRDRNLMTYQYQERADVPTQSPMLLAKAADALFRRRYPWHAPVRAVTIRAIRLAPKDAPEEGHLFIDMERKDKIERLEYAIGAIRARYGKDAIRQAALLSEKKLPHDGRDMVRMPGLKVR